jgi:outer membrane protein assembly factor BamB
MLSSPRYLALPLLLLSLAAAPPEWRQWRGPGRDGVALDQRLPETWPAKFPPPRWKAAVGEGYSSPVIAGGRVFLLGLPRPRQEVCFCFDAATGKRLWRRPYASPYHPPPGCGPDNGPNSTPAVDGDRVYMLGLGGIFHCLDVKTGRILWKHDFRKEYWGVEKAPTGEDAWSPACGVAASPLVVGKGVVVPVGGKKAGTMVAFDRRNGRVLWSALQDRSSYASPILTTLAGARQLVGFTGTRMVGLNVADRKLLWEYPFAAAFDQTILTPVIWKDHAILGGEGKATISLEMTRDGERITPALKWTSAALAAYTTTPVVVQDHLIGLDLRTRSLVCLDLATGTPTWNSPRLTARAPPLHASLVLAGDTLLALTNDGELLAARANPAAYEELGRWKVSKAGGTWAHLAVSGSRLYLREKGHLLCFDLNARR